MSSTQHFKVNGMKCQHCVNSATTALEALDGYESSDIDLAAGTLALTGTVDAEQVCSALTAAGYPTTVAEG